MEFVKNKGASPSDRRTTMSAIRAFYRTNLPPLQELDTASKEEIYEPTPVDTERSIELSRVLTPVDIAMVVRAAKMPYQAIFLTMFQGAMDADAFMQFNSKLWRNPDHFDMKALDSRGPLKISGLVRSKIMGRKAAMTTEEMRRLIRATGKNQSGTATDGDGWDHGQQKVVAAVSLREWVERGWLYVATLPTGEVVIRLP